MISGFRTGCISHILFPRDAADKCMEARMDDAEECKERVRYILYGGCSGFYTNSEDTGDDGTRFHCLAADAEEAIPSVVAPSQSPQLRCVLSRLFPRTCEQLASGLFRWFRYLYRQNARALK